MDRIKLSIVGSGVTGQATGMGFIRHGHDVIFYDIVAEKLAVLNQNGYAVAESVHSAIENSDVIFICVPTPTVNGSMDFSCVENAVLGVSEALSKSKKYRVVVIRSTVLPSTTRIKVVPLLEKHSGLKAGKDFGVSMNPEFLREKFALNDFLNPDRIVIGEYNHKSGDLLEELYSSFNAPILRTNLDLAEMIKYASNLFLAAKISFFNEIFEICQNLSLDQELLGKAVSLDSRIGEYGVFGGRPFDGKCLPKDLIAFIDFAKANNINPKILEEVLRVNNKIASRNFNNYEP